MPSPPFLARRIKQSNQPEQNQIRREIRRTETPGLDRRLLQPCQAQHAFTLRGESIRHPKPIFMPDRRGLFVAGLLSVAMLQDDFRGALDQEHLLPGSIRVQGGHELVFRFERDGVRPRKRRLFDLSFQPDLGGEPAEVLLMVAGRRAKSLRVSAPAQPHSVAMP